MKASEKIKEIEKSAPLSRYDDGLNYEDQRWLIARVKVLTEALEKTTRCLERIENKYGFPYEIKLARKVLEE